MDAVPGRPRVCLPEIRATSNPGNARTCDSPTTMTPVCYVNQNRQIIYETFFFSSVKQNKYIQFKIIFSSKKIQIV